MDEKNKGREQDEERAYMWRQKQYTNYSTLNTKRHCVASTCLLCFELMKGSGSDFLCADYWIAGDFSQVL